MPWQATCENMRGAREQGKVRSLDSLSEAVMSEAALSEAALSEKGSGIVRSGIVRSGSTWQATCDNMRGARER